jgi:hypothetical protein
VPVLHQPDESVGSPLSPQVQQSLMRALARVDELAKRLDIAIITPPAPGSASAVELANKSQAYAYNVCRCPAERDRPSQDLAKADSAKH